MASRFSQPARWIVLGIMDKLPAKLVHLCGHPTFRIWDLNSRV